MFSNSRVISQSAMAFRRARKVHERDISVYQYRDFNHFNDKHLNRANAQNNINIFTNKSEILKFNSNKFSDEYITSDY